MRPRPAPTSSWPWTWRILIWPTGGPGFAARVARSSGCSGRPGRPSCSPACWPAGPADRCSLGDRRPTRAVAGLDLDPTSGRARLSYRRAAELFRVRTGWTLHQLRPSALTHAAEDGTNLPLLLARSRHASVRSLEPYARPGPEAVARHSPRPTRHVAARDPPAPQLEAGRRSRRGGPHSPVEYKEVGLDPDPIAGHAIRSTSRGSPLQSVGSLGTLPAWTCEP
jgi:hypothetical protein